MNEFFKNEDYKSTAAQCVKASSCKVCEGLCPVFECLKQSPKLNATTLDYLANLCTDCGECEKCGVLSENSQNCNPQNSVNFFENSQENSRNLSENSRKNSNENLQEILDKNSQKNSREIQENSLKNADKTQKNSQPLKQNSQQKYQQNFPQNPTKNSQNLHKNHALATHFATLRLKSYAKYTPFGFLVRKNAIFTSLTLIACLCGGFLLAQHFENTYLVAQRGYAYAIVSYEQMRGFFGVFAGIAVFLLLISVVRFSVYINLQSVNFRVFWRTFKEALFVRYLRKNPQDLKENSVNFSRNLNKNSQNLNSQNSVNFLENSQKNSRISNKNSSKNSQNINEIIDENSQNLNENSVNFSHNLTQDLNQNLAQNPPKNPRNFPTLRRYAHHFVSFGFLLCLLATIFRAFYTHFLGIFPPYSLMQPPKFLGLSGGFLLCAGCVFLFILRLLRDDLSQISSENLQILNQNLQENSQNSNEKDKNPQNSVNFLENSQKNSQNSGTFSSPQNPPQTAQNPRSNAFSEVVLFTHSFTLIIFLSAFSGLLLFFLKDSQALAYALYLHLSTILAFFITAPYSKFLHIFFHFIALLKYNSSQKSPKKA